MTRSEYQELVEFLGVKFDAIDRRFDALEGQMDRLEVRMDAIEGRMDGLEGRLTRVEVSVEENRHLIQLVAESVKALGERMDREFVAVRQEMADGFQLQGAAIRDLSARMDRWEGLCA